MGRYRLPAGSGPPLTDVIGHLEATGPTLRVRTKRGDVVAVAAADVVASKALAAAPGRTGDIRNLEHAAAVAIAARPDDEWLRLYRREVPVDVLTAVVDGEVAFATSRGAAVGRGAVTESPDGTRWVGLSAVHVVEEARRRGLARELCGALSAWGAERGATRAYVQVLA